MTMQIKKELVRGAGAVTATLLTTVIVGGTVANSYAGTINTALGIETVQITTDTSDGEDTAYYKSDYGTDIYDTNALEKLEGDCAEEAILEQEEGSVLLKNDNNALPLEEGSSITLFGQNSIEAEGNKNSGGFGGPSEITGPFYSYHSTSNSTQDLVTYLDAMETTYNVNQTMVEAYKTSGYNRVKDVEDPQIGEAPIEFYTEELKESWQSDYNDAAVVMLTRQGSEDCDLVLKDSEGISQLALHQDEKDLLEMLKEEKEKGVFDRIILLVNSNWALELGDLEEYDVDACLWIGSPGGVGFTGVVNILKGEANPSGKLVDTYAKNSLSAPAITNAQALNTCTWTNLDEVLEYCDDTDTYVSDYMIYAEGIYVGYKYYETRYEDVILGNGNADSNVGSSSGEAWNYNDEIAFPFGYGLSYTTFTQTLDAVTYNAETDTYTVTATVTNTGDTAGKSVVEVYAQTPYGDYEKENHVEKSAVQIVAFDKTKELEPGQSETLEIPVERYLLASYDYTNAKSYILSAGDYYFSIGDDAHDALNNILAAKGAEGMKDVLGNPAVGDASKTYTWVESDLDTETYSGSRYTETEVTNQFADADLNNLGTDTVTYLSRNDWEGTYPADQIPVTATEEMMEILDGDVYKKPEDAPSVDDFAQGEDNGLDFVDMKDIDYDDDETWNEFLDQLTVEEMASILVDSNGSDMLESVTMPATYRGDDMDCLEQVTFKATGKSGVVWPSTVVMTSTWNTDEIAKRSSLTANEAYFMGCTEIWSGGPNIHRTPFNGRASAYYSEDGNMGYLVGAIVAENVQKYGIILGYKHLVLNDQEANRESVATFANEQVIREQYLRAFEGAYTKGGALGCMTAFNRIGVTYCGSSSTLLNTVLRGEWGFKGHVTTDAVVGTDYKTHYTSNITAGVDYFCWDMAGFGASSGETSSLSSDVITQAVTAGDGYMLQALREATKHTVYAQSRSILINGLNSTSEAEHITPWWETALWAAKIGFAILTIAFFALYYVSVSGKFKKKQGEVK